VYLAFANSLISIILALIMRKGRKPKCITTVARLHYELGMTAEQFGHLIKREANTVRRLDRKPENGGLRLSEDLAANIGKKTGVSVAWLLGGNADAPITMENGLIWNRSIFEVIEGQTGARAITTDASGRTVEFRVKRLIGKQRGRIKSAEIRAHAASAMARIEGVLTRAFDSRGTDYERALGRLSIFLAEMESAFGSDAAAVQKHDLTIEHLKNLAFLEMGPPIESVPFVYQNRVYETRKDQPEAPIELETKAKSSPSLPSPGSVRPANARKSS